MRKARLTALSFTTALVFTAFVASAAFASPEFNPAKGKFDVTSGKGKLTGPLTITCNKDKGTGEILSATHADIEIDFEGCLILGILVHTPGDSPGIVLITLLGLLCYLLGSTKAAPKVGLYSELTETVVIVGLGQKSEVKGQVIGTVEPLNKKQKPGTVTYKPTNPADCSSENEGKGEIKKAELLANLNGGTFKKAEEETTEEVEFENETEVKA